jgi:hypothetical protein
MAVRYEARPDGRLMAAELRGRAVPARGEGALYRRLARLDNASDAAIAQAATRYGPLGPTGPLPVSDRPLYLWAVGEQLRRHVANLTPLRRWIATGGAAAIPGRLAATAHVLAAMAQGDPNLAQRLVDIANDSDWRPVPGRDHERLLADLDAYEQALYQAIGRRESVIADQVRDPDASIHVVPAPGTGQHIALAADALRALVTSTEAAGGPAEAIAPEALGRFATSLQPYIDQNILPPETVAAWRIAAAELARWSVVVSLIRGATPAELAEARAKLTLRLQQVDAWPYPSGEVVGAFARALWSLWPRIVQQPPRRRCHWPSCPDLLPVDAHGTRRFCDAHRREAARLRAARVRKRAQVG